MEDTCETKASCMQRMIQKIKVSIPEIIGLTVGAVGGFIYYKVVGCSTGACPITSNPWISTVWGAALGYLFGGMFNKNKKSEK
jgi:hypothetical protein